MKVYNPKNENKMSEEEKVAETPAAAPEAAPAAAPAPAAASTAAPTAGGQEKAPGAMMALVFGIIAWCTCWGPIGVVFGFLALGKSKSAKKAYNASPEQYKSPKVFTIIGTIGGWFGIVVGLIYTIVIVMAIIAEA